jgi:protein-tyrosine-phosphatase/DNA-binding HxlR family transcriptional regulator
MSADLDSVRARAAVHAALAEPARLAIVDELVAGDRSPGELAEALGLPTNLLAHHVKVLAAAGLVRRGRSEADRRRTYLRLVPAALAGLVPAAVLPARRVVFVCTRNSARSQLAAVLWSTRSRVPAASAGTSPAPRVHRQAVATARRHGLSLAGARTAHLDEVAGSGDVLVAVCDSAYEEIGAGPGRLHWSVPDPVPAGTAAAFEAAFDDLADRVDRLVPAVRTPGDDQPRPADQAATARHGAATAPTTGRTR